MHFVVFIALLISCSFANELSISFNAKDSSCTAHCSACSSISGDDDVPPPAAEDGVYSGNCERLLNQSNANTNVLNEIKANMASISENVQLLRHFAMETNATMNDIVNRLVEFVQLYNESQKMTDVDSVPPKSCEEIKKLSPSSPSGEYMIAATNGSTQTVYCSMETLCNSDGGWTRVAYLDMNNSSENCPPGFEYRNALGVRACGRPNTLRTNCESVTFPSMDMEYSQICGKVFGYQNGNADGFTASPKDIESYYVHGISLTRGTSPRQHIWTFVAGNNAEGFRREDCPCNTRDGSTNTLGASTVPDFVGEDYFCESAWPGGNNWPFITNDPLWNGKECREKWEGPCCSNAPWFHKTIDVPTSDSIELRLCTNYALLGLYEIYVK